MKILKKTFEEQVTELCQSERCKRKEATLRVQSDWLEEELKSSQTQNGSASPPPSQSNTSPSYKPDESLNWHKHFGTQSIVIRRIKETRDQLLANTWNQLPLESPLYEMGPIKFFEIFHRFDGYILPIVDPKVSIPNSLILHDLIYSEKFSDHEICPLKKELLLEHEDYLKSSEQKYFQEYERQKARCRANLEKFFSLSQIPVWADIIQTYFYMDKTWEESCGFITQKDIQDYLIQHGDKRYKGLTEKDRMWTAPFQKAQKFVPITSSLLGRAKTRPKPIKEVVYS